VRPRRARGVVLLAAGAVGAAAFACGEVPTLPLGIAYVTPVLVPSPSVAHGDTLRDSLGRAAPLRVYALSASGTDTIRSVALRFLFTGAHGNATIDGSGYLVAPDSIETLRIVGQVTDPAGGGLQLQTPELLIDVVPAADSLAAKPTARADTTYSTPLLAPISVTVTGTGPGGVRGPVGGIRVRYRIVGAWAAGAAVANRFYLVDDQNAILRPDSTLAIDTTAAGLASRRLVGISAPAGAASTDSVTVEVRAWSQRYVELAGSPLRTTLHFRSSP
jgi:hypothetical protein